MMAALAALLALAALIPGAGAVVACDGVAPGDTITFEGPDPVQLDYVDQVVYSYLWTAEADGETIATESNKSFSFTVPEVPSDPLYININLLVSDGYGCTKSETSCLTAYARPPCGISGDDSICEDSPITTYSYADDPSSLSFAWKIDGDDAATSDSIEVDWSKIGRGKDGKSFGEHVVTLEVTKTYDDGTTTTSTCSMKVLYIQSPKASFTRVA
jgi:hypothetical protein